MGWIPAYAGGWFCLVGQLTIRRKTQFRGRICSSEDACRDGNAMIHGQYWADRSLILPSEQAPNRILPTCQLASQMIPDSRQGKVLAQVPNCDNPGMCRCERHLIHTSESQEPRCSRVAQS